MPDRRADDVPWMPAASTLRSPQPSAERPRGAVRGRVSGPARGVARRLAAVALAAAAAAPLGGCCMIASAFCDPPGPKSPPRHTRDAPLEAIEFLVDAIRRDAPGEIYDSLHPDLRDREGGFSGFQFRAGYDRFRDEFREDAKRFERATKDAPVWKGGDAWVFVHEADASVWLVFRNRPSARVVAEGEEFTAPVPQLRDLLRLNDSGLELTRPIDLGEQAVVVDPAKVRRVEVFQDWLLWAYVEPRNIRFVDRLREMKGEERP